jgi:uncharacterized membrane protein
MSRIKIVLLLFFAFLGLGVSAYLAYVYIFTLPLPCGLHGCEVVRNSKYASMFGIPVPLFGVAFYLTAIGLGVYLYKTSDVRILYLLFLLALSGFIYSVYLTYLELFVIYAICLWCVFSALMSTGMFIVMSILFLKRGEYEGTRILR